MQRRDAVDFYYEVVTSHCGGMHLPQYVETSDSFHRQRPAAARSAAGGVRGEATPSPVRGEEHNSNSKRRAEKGYRRRIRQQEAL